MYLERQHTDMWFSQQDMERRWNSDDQQTELRSKPKEISGSEEIQSDALPRKMWWHQWVSGDYSRAWGWSLLCKYRVLLRLLLLLNFIFFLPTINSYDFFLSFFRCLVQYPKKSWVQRGHSQKWRRQMPFLVLLLEVCIISNSLRYDYIITHIYSYRLNVMDNSMISILN